MAFDLNGEDGEKSCASNLNPMNVTEKNIDQCERDVMDAPPPQAFFNCIDVLGFIGSVVTFVWDMGTDVALTYFYFYRGDYHYFALTLLFIIVPALVTNIFSLIWYKKNSRDKEEPKVSKLNWIVRIISHAFLMGCLYRYIESLYFGFKSFRSKQPELRRKYYYTMAKRDTDASFLRLFEAFMEAAPQLTLQLYILIKNQQTIRFYFEMGFITGYRAPYVEQYGNGNVPDEDDAFLGSDPKFKVLFQALSVISSIISIAWSLTAYARNMRFSNKKKKNMSWWGSGFHFLWHLSTVAAHVLALALFTSVFTYWSALVVGVRWVAMSTWITLIEPNLCKNKCEKYLINWVLGLVYLFALLNVKDEPTGWKYFLFYFYEIIENIVLIGLWAWAVYPTSWFYTPALVCHVGGMIMGLTCMIIYYTHFHPSLPKQGIKSIICNAFRQFRRNTERQKSNRRPLSRAEMR